MSRVYYLRSDRRVVFNPRNGEYSLASRGSPIICLVSDRNKDTGVIKYGYSILHPEEEPKNYSKAEGVRQATLRLNGEDKDVPPLVVETNAENGHEINKAIVEHFRQTVGKKIGQAWKLSNTWLRVSAGKANAKKLAEVKQDN